MKEYWTQSTIPNKKQMKYFALAIMLLIEFTACQKNKLNIPDTGRKIVVNGLITTDSLLNLKLSKSAYYNDLSWLELLDLDNAGVYFYQNNSSIDSLHFSHKPDENRMFYSSNYWSRTVFPASRQEFKVIVKAPGYPDATSSTIVPDLVQINKLDTSRILVGPDPYHPDLSNVLFLCNINFSDPGNETNYYMIKVSYKVTPFKNDYTEHYRTNIRFYTSDPIIEEVVGDESNDPYAYAFSDKVINGQNYNLKLKVYASEFRMPSGDDLSKITNSTNFKDAVYFSLYSITEDYYKYIQSFNLYKKNYGNPLTEPVMIYSNITGGYGIFGSAAVSTDSLVFYY